HSIVAVVGILFGCALAGVIELCLKPGQAVQQVIAFGAQLAQLSLHSRFGRSRLCRHVCRLLLLLKSVRRISCRQFVLQIFLLFFNVDISLSVGLTHCNTWSFDWDLFHAFSFSSLSKSCAM